MAPPGQPCQRQGHCECRSHHWRAAAWHDAWELHWRTTDSEGQHHVLQYSTRAFAWATVHFGFNRGLRAATRMPSCLKERLNGASTSRQHCVSTSSHVCASPCASAVRWPHGAHHGGASMLVPAIPGDRACETKPLALLLATYPGWSTRRRNPTRQTKSVVPLRSANTE